MGLQLRLALSYVAVILLFGAVFSVSWVAFTARPTLLVLRDQARDYAARLRRTAEQAHAGGGPEAVGTAMRAVLLPPRARLTVFPPEGPPLPVQGDPVPVDEGALQQARGGRMALRLPRSTVMPGRVATAWIPFRAGEAHGVLALSMPAALPPELRRHLAASFLYAGLLGTLTAFVAGFLLSRFLARPLRRLAEATEDVGSGDLSRRVPEEGPGELRDLARRFNRMAASLQQNVEGRRRFLADVSHNLRTPLAAIQGWTEALQDGLAPGEEQDRLARIRREALFASRAVARLLELSRWDSAPSLRPVPVPLSQPLMEAADAVEAAAEGPPPELRVEGPVDTVVQADPEKLRELFQILLENAVQHARGATRVTVTAAAEGGRLRVAVEDDGPGFPPEEIPQLFMGFRRRPGKGTGLGLALAARIAVAHGGSLEASNAPGARLAFTVPLA